MVEEPEHVTWAYRSPCYRALNLVFGVRSTDARRGRVPGSRHSPGCVADEENPEVWYSIAHSGDGVGRTSTRCSSVRSSSCAPTAKRSPSKPCCGTSMARPCTVPIPSLFSTPAELRFDGAGAIISGPSGAGKTTFTAALVRAGFGYLTDEALAIDPVTGLLQPYPKALAIKRGSWELLDDLRPPPTDLSPRVWHVAPRDIRPDAVAGPTPPSLVLLLTPRGSEEPGGAAAGLTSGAALRRVGGTVPAELRIRGRRARPCTSWPPPSRDADCFRVSTEDLGRAVRCVTDSIRHAADDDSRRHHVRW